MQDIIGYETQNKPPRKGQRRLKRKYAQTSRVDSAI